MQPAEQGPVRVRVRAGARLYLEPGRIASGGEWIDLPAVDLAIPSIRCQVETKDEVEASGARRNAEQPKESTASDEFDQIRAAATIHAAQMKKTRDEVDRIEAERRLAELNQEKAAEEAAAAAKAKQQDDEAAAAKKPDSAKKVK